MLEPKASRFWQAALQSGLAGAQALQACWDAIPAGKRVPEHIDRRLARQAVQSGLLTLWQAQQLIAGRSTGFKIDRYVLLQLIGQGGMGRVYLARDTRLNRRVAVKILSPERVNNPRAIARFHREALVGAQLQHENLVRIYDEGEAGGKCYLVMEYIEGRNIGQMIAESGPVPPAVAARLARQVALGLEHAQRKGLIHRDVNPYNILVTRDGTAKLTDLGLAIDLAEQDRVTRDGATVGTFDYVSPEQARHSHSVDTRSDIYSLGCSLYHMLSGQVPFPSASLPEKLFGHQAVEPRPLTELVPAVPAGLAAVVARTMKKLPAARYATPLELAQALEPFADETSGLPPDITPQIRGTPRGGTLKTWVAAPRRGDDGGPATVATTTTPAPVLPPPLPAPVLPTPLPAQRVSAATALSAGPAPAAPGPAPLPPTNANRNGLGLNLAVDLGPEPPLSQIASSARPKAKATALDAVRTAWLIPFAAAAGLVVIAAGAAVAYRAFGGGDSGAAANAAGGSGSKTGDRKAEPGATRPGAAANPSATREPTGQEVAVVAADGTRRIEPDLASAMRAAIGGRGYVLLLNRAPLKVSAGEAAVLSGGTLVIRAGAGVRPVIEVEVKGPKPFLTTRTDTPLRIEGVTIVARYVDPGDDPAAVIEAAGNVTLDRCAFRAEGAAAGARAVALEGGALTASGCWFENFDRAIDISCFAGSTTTLRQCMVLNTRPADPSTPAPAGWAVRLRSMPGGFAKTGRRLVMDHCTVKGKGFLDFAEFSPRAPVTVDLDGCALMADDALISWEDLTTAPPTREALSWQGREDLYDVRGRSWVLILPRKGETETPMPDGPTNLDSWTKQLGIERDPAPAPVRFATDPAALPERPGPADFAVTNQGDSPPGADPAQVGPGAKP